MLIFKQKAASTIFKVFSMTAVDQTYNQPDKADTLPTESLRQ